MKEIWKKFNEVELTHSSVHHLIAIHKLHKEYGYARAIDIAKFLNITRGSVAITLNKLKKRGYIREDDNKFLSLTDDSQQLVNGILSKRRIVVRFFMEVLQLSEEDAEIDACKIEHLLSHKTGEKMMSFMGYFLSDSETAKAFREGFREFSYHCQSSGECDTCETECYFSGRPVQEENSVQSITEK